jgi:hypothetical protein
VFSVRGHRIDTDRQPARSAHRPGVAGLSVSCGR